MSGFVKFAQYLCVTIALISVNTVRGQHYLDSSNFNELYRQTDEPLIKVLAPGDSESEYLELNPPVHFYSSKYDGVYINTNGILTFVIEFPEYLNHPFPLEYPSIAAFYSNVDTLNGNDSTSISIFQTQNADKLEKASGLIRYSFPDMYDFEATTLYVATWENVGYFSGKTDKLNTFQAIIICSADETYVQFIYPKGGINWLQADTGELGLPDIRAQAGFISEDERFYTVDGSGTDNARFLSRMSNVGVEGVFLYHVGPLDEAGNVNEPFNEDTVTETAEPTTCAEGKRKCHITAACVDKSDGFCCRCAAGFYGNGESCIKENIPIRVTGSVSGKINGIEIESSAKLQSYIVMQDGRSYTVINPISTNLGAQLKLALPIAGSLGWLFAKPASADKLNGYQLSGGHLLHTSRLTFHSGEVLLINQTFEGLNYWDQLSMKIQISGEVPNISPEVKLQMAEFVEEFTFTSPNSLVSDANRQIDIPSQNSAIIFDLHQEISFNRCSLDDDSVLTGTTVLQKISKISLEFSAKDLALRSGLQAKVGVSSVRGSCSDEGDCGCRDGYERQHIDDETEGCVDIDECAIGIHICDENAFCSNVPGGYTCVCAEGFFGNGKECDPIESNHLAEVESDHGEGEPVHGEVESDATLSKEDDQAEKEEEEKRRMQEEERLRHEEERLRQVEERRRADEEKRRLEEDIAREDEERRRDEANRRAEEERISTGEERRRADEERWRGREETLQEEYDMKVEDEEEQRREEDRRDHVKWDNTRSEEEEQIFEQDLEKQAEPSSDCYRCSKDANCVEGRCECRGGYNGNGFICQYNCIHETEVWENGKCVRYTPDESEVEPTCNVFGDCSCPDGYDLSDEENICRPASSSSQQGGKGGSDSVPCDVDNACHDNATCEWSEQDMRHICICNHGYLGDGFTCSKINESCTTNPELCGVHATCEYNEAIGKSECQCEPHYEGDGFQCQLSAECRSDTDCGQSAYCDKGVCQCIEGYERDLSDFCVPAGMCGGTFCAGNAACKWDPRQNVQYCECMEGYTGDGVTACKSVPISCRVRNTCGVHASCIPSRTDPAQYECVCDGGFYGDGYLCMEEQNCQNTPTLCDPNAKCQSVTNGIACVCNPGYLGNGTVCRVRPTHDSGFLLISQGVVIVRVPFNGKQSRPISVASMTVGLDKDCIEGRVYWGDISTKKIVSAKYDGTDNRPLITEDIMSPEGIAIDAVSRRIYWTDSEKDTVEVASLDNPNMRAVLVNKYLVNPRGIAVDPYREKLYWSDWNRESPKIEMSNLDGTGREILLSKPSVSLPNSLVVIRDSGALCFADAGSHKIECIDFYTKQVRTVASDLKYPFGLASTDSNFYWTDWMSKKLESVDTFGKRQPGIQTTFYGSHKMYGMVAVEEYCPQHSNPCQMNNGGCGEDRICLANSRAPSGKSCKCTMKSKCIMSYDESIYQSP